MAVLSWKTRRSLEISLASFLQTQSSGTTVLYNGTSYTIDVRVGNTIQDNWKIPNISVYIDTKTAPRGFIGNNKRLESYLMIIDIRAWDDAMRSDLAEWVTTTINNGFPFYDYVPNPSDPDNPTKTLSGTVSVDFVTDNPLRPVDDANIWERFRHNISVSLTITA